MSIIDSLLKCSEVRYWAVSKRLFPDGLPQYIVAGLSQTISENSDSWFMPCSHSFFDPAPVAELEELIARTPQLPVALLELYRFSNGAELFRVPPAEDESLSYIWKYRILNIRELLRVQAEELNVFLSFAGKDENYRDVKSLNYLAYCDLGDGNYLAVSLEPSSLGVVFFLDHEYEFFPWDDEFTRDAYFQIAPSIESWFQMLVEFQGQCGLMELRQ